MNRSQPLAPVARSICLIVEQSPGIHFRGLGRAANVSSTGQLRHHLDRLRRQGAVIEVEDGRFRRYFVPGHDERTREAIARLARPVPRRIALLLLERDLTRSQLRRSLGCADSTLGYHLNRMLATGDLQRERDHFATRYRLTTPELVRHVFAAQDADEEGPTDASSLEQLREEIAAATSERESPVQDLGVDRNETPAPFSALRRSDEEASPA